MRYELQIKQMSAGGGLTSGVPAPAPVRPGTVELDQGRRWAGDLYEEGAVSNPDEAYARFAGGEEAEAWLDRNTDGTLTGWVREGDQVWRYSDAEAWALDVDGAQMQRTDAAPTPPPDPAAEGEDLADVEDAEAEGAEPVEDEYDNPFALPEDEVDAAAEDPELAATDTDEAEGDLDDPAVAAAVKDPSVEVVVEDEDEAPAEVDASADPSNPGTAPGPNRNEQLYGEEDQEDRLFGGQRRKAKIERKELVVGIAPGPTRRPRGTVRPRRGR